MVYQKDEINNSIQNCWKRMHFYYPPKYVAALEEEYLRNLPKKTQEKENDE